MILHALIYVVLCAESVLEGPQLVAADPMAISSRAPVSAGPSVQASARMAAPSGDSVPAAAAGDGEPVVLQGALIWAVGCA